MLPGIVKFIPKDMELLTNKLRKPGSTPKSLIENMQHQDPAGTGGGNAMHANARNTNSIKSKLV